MAASRLSNVRYSKYAFLAAKSLNFRIYERRIHTTASSLRRGKVERQENSAAIEGKDENSVSTSGEQSVTKSSSNVEEDFFGFLSGEGVTDVETSKDGPIDVIKKYESMVAKQWPSDMEKMYVTNFGTIRLDSDNPVKFHGQLDAVALQRKNYRECFDDGELEGFPDPQTKPQKNIYSKENLVLKNELVQDKMLEYNKNKSHKLSGRKSKVKSEKDGSDVETLPSSASRQPQNALCETEVDGVKLNETAKNDGPTVTDSSYIEDQYFSNIQSKKQDGKTPKSDADKSPMDIGYFDKLYESETNTNMNNNVAKSSEINDSNYSSYVLSHFQNENMQKEQQTDEMERNLQKGKTNYLEENLFNQETWSVSEAHGEKMSPLTPFISENVRVGVPKMGAAIDETSAAMNKLPSSLFRKEQNRSDGFKQCKTQSCDKNRSASYLLNVLPDKTDSDNKFSEIINNVTLQSAAEVKRNFLEESVVEYTETLQQSSTEQMSPEMLGRLQQPPPFSSKSATSFHSPDCEDGDIMDTLIPEKRPVPQQQRNVYCRPAGTSNQTTKGERFKTPHDLSRQVTSQSRAAVTRDLIENSHFNDDFNASKNSMVEAKFENTESRRSKGENTVFGTHPELKTRQKSVELLAYKQRQSTTGPQQPRQPPERDEDADYIEREDADLPVMENIGLRVTVPEPRFDKKPKFVPRESNDEPMYADEFVSEYLKKEEESLQVSEDDVVMDDNTPVNLGKLVVKTQNLEEQPTFVVLQLLKDSIMYNNNGVLVLYKPYGLPMQPSKGYRHNLVKFLPDLAKYVDHENPKAELYTVHRLDRGTTGVLVLAKNQEMAKNLQNLFKARKVRKTYWAITKGIPDPWQGIINIPIAEGTVDGRRRMVLKPDYNEDTKLVVKKSSVAVHEAITPYRILTAKGNTALVEATPQTGVTHQLRVHFGFGLGCPVLGDHKYTHLARLAPQRLPADMLKRLNVRQSKVRDLPIHLHSRSIVIPEILDGKNIYIQAGLPKHMQWAVRKLKLRRHYIPPNKF